MRISGTDKVAVASAPVSALGGSVALSATARYLAQLGSLDNDINIVRVNEIRDALASGTLKINPERIAEGLLADAQALLIQKK